MADPGSRQVLLRQEVGLFRARESRRVFDTSVHVGVPGGPRESFVVRRQDLPRVDPGLRIDVVDHLVAQSTPTVHTAWLTRPGQPLPHDLDQQWLAAALVGFGVHGRRLECFYAITRTGWLDVRTGERRVWARLRL